MLSGTLTVTVLGSGQWRWHVIVIGLTVPNPHHSVSAFEFVALTGSHQRHPLEISVLTRAIRSLLTTNILQSVQHAGSPPAPG
jgi:hypothetical protein